VRLQWIRISSTTSSMTGLARQLNDAFRRLHLPVPVNLAGQFLPPARYLAMLSQSKQGIAFFSCLPRQQWN
jgi:hypothetical protein